MWTRIRLSKMLRILIRNTAKSSIFLLQWLISKLAIIKAEPDMLLNTPGLRVSGFENL
jgi:hypothetical protein